MGPLGCAQDYIVQITDRYGAQAFGQADAESVTWGRVLDDTSDATISVPYQGPECCDLMGAVNPWCNDVVLFRDGERVWEGPVVDVRYRGGATLIYAQDVTAWLWRRIIRELLDFTAAGSGAQDLTDIALALIMHGLERDDPGVLAYLQARPAGITGQRRYLPNSGLVGDAFQELARTGIDYTALGRRILLGPEVPLARLMGLEDDDFSGDLEVHVDGKSAATAAVVVGKGVAAEAGGIGPCGLLEHLAQEDDILDALSAQAEAQAIVAAGNPTPVYVDVPAGSQLSPTAPVGINDLIPGIVCPVTSTQTCRTVSTDLRLQRLSVTFDKDGERVGVTMAPLGVDTDAD